MSNMSSEANNVINLKGTAANPAKDPKVGAGKAANPNSVGTKAFNDALCIVLGCWILLILLHYSLRHHNI